MKKAVLVLVALSLALMPLSVAAAARLSDPNDSNGLLDIRAIQGHYDSSTGVLTLVTREAWGCKALRRGVKTSLKWFLDGKSDGDFDLVGKFVCVSPNTEPTLVLKLHGTDSGNNYEPVPAKKPNRRTVRVKFPFDLTEINSKHVTVVAKSKDGISEGCSDSCPDETGPLKLHRHS